MTLAEIKARLKSGQHPEDFAKALDSGMFREAFLIGDYVIKKHVARIRRMGMRVPPLGLLSKLGLHPPECHFVTVNKYVWVIQPFYKPVPFDQQQEFERYWFDRRYLWRARAFMPRIRLDLHYGNIGLDDQGRQVLFDW